MLFLSHCLAHEWTEETLKYSLLPPSLSLKQQCEIRFISANQITSLTEPIQTTSFELSLNNVPRSPCVAFHIDLNSHFELMMSIVRGLSFSSVMFPTSWVESRLPNPSALLHIQREIKRSIKRTVASLLLCNYEEFDVWWKQPLHLKLEFVSVNCYNVIKAAAHRILWL